MKQGFSEYCVHKEGCFVIKWTKGKEAVQGLRADTYKNIHEIEYNQLYPFKPVNVLSVIEEPEFYSVKMPYLADKTVYELPAEPIDLFSTYKESISNRIKMMNPGFKTIALGHLSKLVDRLKKKPNPEQALFLVYKIETLIKKCNDLYPFGYCHGDLGLANIFHVGDKFIVIDFTDTFIHSPLMDLASIVMSNEQADEKIKWHKPFEIKLINEFKEFTDQIEILKKLRYFEYLINADPGNRWRYIELLND